MKYSSEVKNANEVICKLSIEYACMQKCTNQSF